MSRRFTQGNAGELIAGAVIAAAVFGVSAGLVALADAPLEPCTSLSTSACSGPPVDHSTNGSEKETLAPCPTEDSVGCYWDASESGNGRGHDVVNQP